ncbi:MAG: VOC family protein [Sphingopyxis sp.]|nr:VOC family protein [Sphingopyxis sp.]
MPALRLEHVNLTVSNPDRSAALLAAIFGWHIRWRGPSQFGGSTIHLGDDSSYVALYTGPDGQHANVHWEKGVPLNHVGVEVDDLDATEARVVGADLAPFSHSDYGPSRSFYFFDHDGIEWEVVSYCRGNQGF